jgi:hypothetical protein
MMATIPNREEIVREARQLRDLESRLALMERSSKLQLRTVAQAIAARGKALRQGGRGGAAALAQAQRLNETMAGLQQLAGEVTDQYALLRRMLDAEWNTLRQHAERDDTRHYRIHRPRSERLAVQLDGWRRGACIR